METIKEMNNSDLRLKLFLHALVEAGISRTDFARDIGVSKQLVSQSLSGSNVSRPVLEKIDKFIEKHTQNILNTVQEWFDANPIPRQ